MTREMRQAAGTVRVRSTPTVAAWVLPHLLAYVSSQGCDVTPIRQLPGIRGRDLDDPDMRIADSTTTEAWRLAAQLTADEDLGLSVAKAIPAGALDLLEFAFRSSATLGLALGQIVRYARVARERASPRLTLENDALTLRWSGSQYRHRAEFALAFVTRLAREATEASFAPMEVRFAHRPPPSISEHRAFFRTRLRFDEPATQLLVARPDADRPFRSADAALSRVVCRRLEKMLARLAVEEDSLGTRVRRVLHDTMAAGRPTAASVARELGLSERSLHRRLRSERTSFRGILDRTRGELAIALLGEPGIGIGDVAFFLGYSEPAAFHRFFRRFTGQTPRSFRRGPSAEADDAGRRIDVPTS
jgi:AraC-like DNA-binding protein